MRGVPQKKGNNYGAAWALIEKQQQWQKKVKATHSLETIGAAYEWQNPSLTFSWFERGTHLLLGFQFSSPWMTKPRFEFTPFGQLSAL